MSSKQRYYNLKAEGQDHPKNCWAACLVWWLKASLRGVYEQDYIVQEYSYGWNNNGDNLLSKQAILDIVTCTEWRMFHQEIPTVAQFDKAVLSAHLNFGPVYIGYYEQAVGSHHVNVIYDMWGNDINPQVRVMEPAAVRNNADATYKGKHLTRGLNHYKQSGAVILASPDVKV